MALKRKNEASPDTNFMVRGDRYRATHQQSVNAILPASGADFRPVVSKGSQFYNRDRWTARLLTKEMCDWAARNPGAVPTQSDVRAWVDAANAESVWDKGIVIAATPDRLPVRTAMALVGGAYHEAWHTLYSCRRDIKFREVWEIVYPRFPLVQDWSKYHGMIQTWSNVVEDIRIERLGCREFPGVRTKMADLQDYILKAEADGDEAARAHGHTPGALNVVTRAFRDLGLGYNTDRQRSALDDYRNIDAKAYAFVTQGPLASLVRESIALKRHDDLGCLRIALDVIIALVQASQAQPQSQPSEDGEGKGQGQQCPKCKAGAKHLVIRAIKGKPNKGLLCCTKCGHQEEVDVEQSDAPSQSSGPAQEAPRMEGFNKPEPKDSPEESNGGGGGGGEPEEDGEPEEANGSGSESGEDEGDDAEEAKGSGSDGDEGEDEGEDEDAEGESGDTSKDAERPERPEGEGESTPDAEPEGESGDAESDANPVGGGHYDAGENDGLDQDWSEVANDALDAAANGEDGGIKDNNSALADGVNAETDKEDGPVEDGEAVWRPTDPNMDTVQVVRSSSGGADSDRRAADKLLKEAMPQIRFLRSRLRQILKAAEMTDTVHGLPKGRLSERMLVDSKVSLMAGKAPRRAYMQTDAKMDTSTAVACILDESGSMSGILRDMTKALMAVVEPMDKLGAKVLVAGVRNGSGYTPEPEGDHRVYHRQRGVRIDVFKGFHERFESIKGRFACTKAQGGTPLADGCQYGLKALMSRPEGHRIMFVFTDGCPDWGHLPVIKWQLRKAKMAGIHVVGVGLGYGAEYVKDVYPDHIYAERLEEMPALMIRKLNALFDNRCSKRGKVVKLTA